MYTRGAELAVLQKMCYNYYGKRTFVKSKKQKIFILAVCLVCVMGFFAANHAFAASGGLVPCGRTGQAPCKFEDFFVLVARVTNWLVGVAGAYAVYVIISNSWWLITSMGNEEDITKRKNGISQAVFGLVFVLFAFLIVNTAVNILLLRGVKGCQLDLTNPLSYLKIDESKCPQVK